MLSGFSKLFDKAFAVGFLLPVLLALCATAWLFPELGLTAPLHNLAAAEDTTGKLLYVGLVMYAGAILLTLLNRPLYRLLEGYLLFSDIDAMAGRHEAAREALVVRHRALLERWSEEGDAFPLEDQQTANALKKTLVALYPPVWAPVLPTRFGNVLRAFESYPLEIYGADGVPAWTRLASVISKEFAAGADEARAQVDCLVNLIALGAVLGSAATGLGLWRTANAMLRTPWPPLLADWRPDPRFWAGAALLALIYPLYLWAVERALAWGEWVRAGFDTYLPALIKQLGYVTPRTESDRRRLWADLNGRFVYREPFQSEWPAEGSTPPPPRFAERQTPSR